MNTYYEDQSKYPKQLIDLIPIVGNILKTGDSFIEYYIHDPHVPRQQQPLYYLNNGPNCYIGSVGKDGTKGTGDDLSLKVIEGETIRPTPLDKREKIIEDYRNSLRGKIHRYIGSILEKIFN